MIKLLFQKDKSKFIITIEDKKVNYWDELEGAIWGGSIQYLPPCPETRRKILFSRNKIPMEFLNLITISQEDYDDYMKCENDEQIKALVIMDALKHGYHLEEEFK